MVKFLMVGCLGVILAGSVAAYSAWRWWENTGRDHAAMAVQTSADQAVDSSQLADDDKRKLKGRIRGVVTDFKDGRISTQDVARAMEQLAANPALHAASMINVMDNASTQVKLTPQERATVERAAQRFGRGVVEGKIATAEVGSALDGLVERGTDGTARVRRDLSRADVLEQAQQLKRRADDASVPDQPYSVDVVEAFAKALDAMRQPVPEAR